MRLLMMVVVVGLHRRSALTGGRAQRTASNAQPQPHAHATRAAACRAAAAAIKQPTAAVARLVD